MAQQHREYILEVFADQTFVKDIVKGANQANASLCGPFQYRPESIQNSTILNKHYQYRSPPHHILPPLLPLHPPLPLHP